VQAFDEEDEKMFGAHFARMDGVQAAKGATEQSALESDAEIDDEEEFAGGDSLLSMLDANLAKKSTAIVNSTVKSHKLPAVGAGSDSDDEDGGDLLAMVAALDGKGGKGGAAASGNANTNRFWRTATGTVGGADSEYAVGAGSTVSDKGRGSAIGDMAEASQGATASTDAASAVQQLSLASLMQGLAREGDGSVMEGGAHLKKQLSDLSSAGGPIAALAGSATQARAERKVAYGAASKDVSRWQAVVAANRAAPSVSFTHEVRSALAGITSKQTSSGLKDKFTPETDLEAEVSALLAAAGVEGEGAVAAAEADELAAADVTPAEAKKRTQQLAKLRALMFYDEQKKARANKIKSKAFRRVLKRTRLREAEAIANKLKEENP
jgi:U3 small nucleolar RNA-associated protein 14